MPGIFDVYEVKEELGRGAFSIVKLAVNKKTGEKYAVKIIDKKNVGTDLVRLETEIQILKKVNHPNIISMKELFDTHEYLFIVTELVTGGELFDKIVERGSYTEKTAALLVTKIVSAIHYLHNLGIVHRDLKPENLLLKDPGSDTEVKLADFGLSKIVGPQVMMTACGTPGYVAPEVLSATGYDKEVDLWSIGVITYILLCGFPPFYNEDLPQLFEQIMKAEYDFPAPDWDVISDDAKNFIRQILVLDPHKRPTSAEALQHPWMISNAQNATALSTFNSKMTTYVAKRNPKKK
jgi:calcium/calmodulin-dependent protein kinase I